MFIWSWVNGHLSYLHLLAIVNNAAVNTHVQDVMWTYVSFLLYISRSGVVVSCDTPCLALAEPNIFQESCTFYILTNNTWWIWLLHIFTNPCYFPSFQLYWSWWVWRDISCGFHLHFPYDDEHLSCAYLPFVYLLGGRICYVKIRTFYLSYLSLY